MRRLRFFRVLLPALLVVFLVVLIFVFNPPQGVHVVGLGGEKKPRFDGIIAIEYNGADTAFEFKAASVMEEADGRHRFENLEWLKWHRENGEPLIITATGGGKRGEPGSRVLSFDGEVTLYDPTEDLRLTLPSLTLDEAAGEARSNEPLDLQGPDFNGRAERLVYGLEDQPTELFDPSMTSRDGTELTAKRALLLGGLDDVELLTDVRVTRGAEHLYADRLRFWRGANHRLQRATARGSVETMVLLQGDSQPPANLKGDRLDVRWDPAGELVELQLWGGAHVESGPRSVAAENIRMWRRATQHPGWSFDADGSVVLTMSLGLLPGTLHAKSISAEMDAALNLTKAEAIGPVSLRAPGTRAEASRVTFTSRGNGAIRLFGTSEQKARLSRLRTRVAAELISTAPDGHQLHAQRSVEASLMPAAGSPGLLFRSDEAVHFVADELVSDGGAVRLRFEGGVRAWQGDRNLSADSIIVDQAAGTLLAVGNVTARVPRANSGGSAGQSDYIQISGNRLDYSEQEGRALFSEDVRVVLMEGWVEAHGIEFSLSSPEQEIREIQATREVRFEFRQPPASDDENPRMVTGKADRLIYTPLDETVRLIGEDTPASVRQIGAHDGTTTGRVLTYRLKLGTVEVEGAQVPARITTSD